MRACCSKNAAAECAVRAAQSAHAMAVCVQEDAAINEAARGNSAAKIANAVPHAKSAATARRTRCLQRSKRDACNHMSA